MVIASSILGSAHFLQKDPGDEAPPSRVSRLRSEAVGVCNTYPPGKEAPRHFGNDDFIAFFYTQLKLTNSDLSERAVSAWKVHIKK